MTEIVLDTAVLIGYGWRYDKSYSCCSRFFSEYPIERNSFYYPKKVKEELKYKRKRISRDNTGFESELRRMHQFIDRFLENSQKLDYENSEYNWHSIYFTIEKTMKKCQQKPTDKVSFDANHITNYVCFCLEKKENSDHFFITGDVAMYDTRRELWKAACEILDKEIYFSIKNIWNFR
ncbi:MAG: hypothetical protein HXS54_11290 [Theionarchaea archaeon]|nr:hypothetical protein [Theionarchaea archaeon]